MQLQHENLTMEVDEIFTSKSALEPFGSSFIPIIDISAWLDPTSSAQAKSDVVHQIGIALKEVGFIIIIGHGIQPVMIEQAW